MEHPQKPGSSCCHLHYRSYKQSCPHKPHFFTFLFCSRNCTVGTTFPWPLSVTKHWHHHIIQEMIHKRSPCREEKKKKNEENFAISTTTHFVHVCHLLTSQDQDQQCCAIPKLKSLCTLVVWFEMERDVCLALYQSEHGWLELWVTCWQVSHLYGFSPLCVRLCLSMWYFWMKRMLHWSQLKGFSPAHKMRKEMIRTRSFLSALFFFFF